MKIGHKWNESFNEKLFFMNTKQQIFGEERRPLKNTRQPATFYCAAPQAKLVELAGDFNHWHPLPMQRWLDGWWLARVELSHGHHHYRFLVDGKPMLDPQATGVARDEMDERVSLIAVS